MGLVLEGLLEIKAEYFEKGLEAILTTLDKISKDEKLNGRPVIFFWDTIATVPTKAEFERGAYAGGMAEKPRLLRAMARDLASQLSQYNAHLVLVNQVGATMNSYGKQQDTSGGGGPKYQASVRLELSRAGMFNEGDNVAGIITRVKVIKSSLFRPLATVELPIYFNSGLNDHLSVVQHLLKTGDVQNRGGRYYYPSYFGNDAAGKYLKDFVPLVVEDEILYHTMKKRCFETIGLCWQKVKEDKEKEG
jgi:RecA/RadA recombinase